MAIMAAISFAAVFAGGGVLYYNISWKTDLYHKNFIGEMPEVELTAASPGKTETLLKQTRELAAVRKAIYSDTVMLQDTKKREIFCYLTEDFSQYDTQERAYEGRFPKFSNEIALGGLLAGKLEKEPGDTILLTKGDEKVIAVNYRKKVEASIGSYQGIVGILIIVVLSVTAAVIALTLYLVVKTSLLREKRQLGIQKAVSFLPVVLFGATAGCLAGYFGINPVLSVLLSGLLESVILRPAHCAGNKQSRPLTAKVWLLKDAFFYETDYI